MLSGFENEYDLEKTLGHGAYGICKKCRHKKDGSYYAVKIITKSNLTEHDKDKILNEVDILQSLSHEYIIKLFSAYDEPETYFLVAELISGGELFARMAEKSTFAEKEAIDVTKTLLTALAYMHGKNITHRDLKPENILLLNEENESELKIVDFGMAKRVTGPQCLTTKCGTPLFIAPEVLKGKKYGTKVDAWSLGVIIYTLLCGYEPFRGKPANLLYHRIVTGKFRFHPEQWDGISDKAKLFIRCLIEVDPEKRISAKDALQHEWVCSHDEKVLARSLSCDWLKIREASRRDLAKAKARKVFNSVVVKNRLEKLTSKGRGIMDSAPETLVEKLRGKRFSDDLSDAIDSVLRKSRIKKLAQKLIPEDRPGIIDFDYSEQFERDIYEGTINLDCSIDLEKSIDLNSSGFVKHNNFRVAKNFESSFDLGKSIGSRGFETIKEATCIQTNSKHAVRITFKSDLLPVLEECLFNEIKILQSSNHDNIVRLHDVYDDPHSYFLVTDLAQENLLDWITTDRIGFYNDKVVRDVCKTFLHAVSHCHDNKIAHRDIKLENILVISSDGHDYKVKLGNFGFANVEKEADCLVTLCGTPTYVAPEILKGHSYGTMVDLWSFGVMVYFLLSGTFPFYDKTKNELYKMIVKGNYDFPHEYWDDGISSAAKDFIRKLLVVDAKRRMSADDALQDEWILCSDSCFSNIDLQPSVIRLKKYALIGCGVTTCPSLRDKLNSLGPIGCLDDHNESLMNDKLSFISLKCLKLNGWM